MSSSPLTKETSSTTINPPPRNEPRVQRAKTRRRALVGQPEPAKDTSGRGGDAQSEAAKDTSGRGGDAQSEAAKDTNGRGEDAQPVPANDTNGRATNAQPEPANDTSGRAKNAQPEPAKDTSGRAENSQPEPAKETSGRAEDVQPEPAKVLSGRAENAQPEPAMATSGRDINAQPEPAKDTSGRAENAQPVAAKDTSGRAMNAQPEQQKGTKGRVKNANPEPAKDTSGRAKNPSPEDEPASPPRKPKRARPTTKYSCPAGGPNDGLIPQEVVLALAAVVKQTALKPETFSPGQRGRGQLSSSAKKSSPFPTLPPPDPVPAPPPPVRDLPNPESVRVGSHGWNCGDLGTAEGITGHVGEIVSGKVFEHSHSLEIMASPQPVGQSYPAMGTSGGAENAHPKAETMSPANVQSGQKQVKTPRPRKHARSGGPDDGSTPMVVVVALPAKVNKTPKQKTFTSGGQGRPPKSAKKSIPTSAPLLPPLSSPTPAPFLPPQTGPTPAPALPPESRPTPAPALLPETRPTSAPALPPETRPTPAPALPPETRPTRALPPPPPQSVWVESLGLSSGDVSTAGAGFEFLTLTVYTGEDVAGKVLELSQKGSKCVCVLGANGYISGMILRHHWFLGLENDIEFEGKHKIVSLTGMFLSNDWGNIGSKSGGLKLAAADVNGKVVGGKVVGFLVAATPVHVMVGRFTPHQSAIPYPPPKGPL